MLIAAFAEEIPAAKVSRKKSGKDALAFGFDVNALGMAMPEKLMLGLNASSHLDFNQHLLDEPIFAHYKARAASEGGWCAAVSDLIRLLHPDEIEKFFAEVKAKKYSAKIKLLLGFIANRQLDAPVGTAYPIVEARGVLELKLRDGSTLKGKSSEIFAGLWQRRGLHKQYVWIGPGAKIKDMVAYLPQRQVFGFESRSHAMLVERTGRDELIIFDPLHGFARRENLKELQSAKSTYYAVAVYEKFDPVVKQQIPTDKHEARDFLLKAVRGNDRLSVRNILDAFKDKTEKLINVDILLQDACAFGAIDALKELVERGYNLAVIDARGSTLLHQAVLSGSEEVVRYLMSTGAKAQLHQKNNGRATPMDFARAYSPHLVAVLEEFVKLPGQAAGAHVFTTTAKAEDHSAEAGKRK